MLLQSLMIDGFTVKEVSMDIVKDKEDIGYTVFRNTLVEQRLKLLNLYELIREITNLEKNEATGKVDHPRQSVKVVNGETIKSVGKDIADSLGGAIYNATLSVDVNELDFIDGVTIADSSLTINNGTNEVDQLFGYVTNNDGSIRLLPSVSNDIDNQISVEVQKQMSQSHKVVQQIQDANPDSKLSAQQIRDMYDEFTSDGMILF